MLNTIGGFDCVYPHTRYHVMTCYDFVVLLSLTHFRAAQYNFDVVIEKCEALKQYSVSLYYYTATTNHMPYQSRHLIKLSSTIFQNSQSDDIIHIYFFGNDVLNLL